MGRRDPKRRLVKIMATLTLAGNNFEEQLKRRIMAARAAGWDENTINQFATQDIAQHQAQLQAQPQTQQTEQPKKKSNFLLDTILPIIGGSIGAVGGFAVGGPVGAIAGGAAGSGGAKALANKIEGNPAGDQVFSNAVFGALGGAGKAFQSLKAAKALKTAVAATNNTAGVASTLIQAPKTTGLIENIGKNMKAGASGYGVGSKVAGQQPLTGTLSDQIGNTLKTLKIPATAPENQARLLDNRLGNLEKILTSHYANGNLPLTTEELNNLASGIIGKVTANVGSGADKYTMERLQQLVKSGDTSGLWSFVKNLERQAINFGANPSAKLVDREAAARIIKQDARDLLNSKVPGIADVNNLYSNGRTAQTYILSKSKDPGGGLFSRIFSLTPVKTIEAKIGVGLEKSGQYSAGTGGTASKITNQLKWQTGARLFPVSGSSPETTMTPGDLLNSGQNNTTSPSDLLSSGGQTSTPSNNYGGQSISVGGQTIPLSSFTPEVINQMIKDDIARTGGKNIDTIATIVGIQDTLVKQQPKPSSNIGKVSAQAYGLAQQGMNALDQLSQLITQDPGVLKRTAVPGRGLPVIGGALQSAAGTNTFDTLGFAAISSLLRAQSGAAVPDSEVRSYMRAYLPGPFDPPETVKKKLQTLQYDFQTVLGQGQQNDTGTGNDLLDQLIGNSSSGSSSFDPSSQLNYAQ